MSGYIEFYEKHGVKFLSNQPNPKQYKGYCPLHDDKNPSFSVEVSTGKWNCFAGCGSGNAFTFADRGGISPKEVPGDTVNGPDWNPWRDGEIVAKYAFYSASGKYLFHEVKFKPKQFNPNFPEKDFRLAILNKAGVFEPGISSLGDEKFTLYMLPEFLEHPSNVAWICEGPKDVETLVYHGLRATTCPMGASNFRQEYAHFFKDVDVVVPVDNDPAGEKFGNSILAVLKGVASSVKIVRFVDTIQGYDVTDYMSDHKLPDLLALKDVDTSRFGTVEPVSVLLKRVFPDRSDWLIEGVWTSESKGFVAGNPGSGKTWFTLNMALSVASGVPFLGVCQVPACGKVLYIQEEITERNLQKRLNLLIPPLDLIPDAYDRLVSNFHHFTNKQFNLPEDVDELILKTQASQYKLIVIDSFSEVHSINENSAEDIRRVLAPLTRLRNETGASVVIVHHLHKSSHEKTGRSIFERMRGSSAMWGWRDAVIGMECDPEVDDDAKVHFQFRDAEKTASFHFMREKVVNGFIFKRVLAEDTDQFKDKIQAITDVLMGSNDPLSKNAIITKVKGNRNSVLSVLKNMENKGLIEPFGGKLRLVSN